MSLNIPLIANPKALTVIPPDATPIDIYTASVNLRAVVNSISVCNTTASPDVFSISLVSPADVVFDIFRDAEVGANETIFVIDHEVPIFDGWSLRVEQGAAAESLHFIAVIGEISVVRGA